jgi:hypothetical protein
VCCASLDNNKPKLACENTSGGACANGLKIECDDPSDCPTGEVCCGTRNDSGFASGGFASVSCQSSCDGTQDHPAVLLCNPKAAVDECAAIQKTCQASDALSGYFVCR